MITLQPHIVFLLMIFFHIIDDYRLQGILADMKQKSWWEKLPGYSSLYRYDYIVALVIHGFSWSFMIHIPILIYFNFHLADPSFFVFVVISQGLIHSMIDELKANIKCINLVYDQVFHLFQIILSFVGFLYM